MLNILFLHYAIIDKEGFGRTFKLAKEMSSLGNKVVFITTQSFSKRKFPFKVEYRDNVKIISFPELLPDKFSRTGFGFFSAILKLIYLIKRHQFDIIHSDTGHRPSAAIPAFFLQYIYKIPHVMEWWDYFGRGGQFDEKSFLKKITHGYYDLFTQKRLMKSASGLIVLSEFLKNRALDINIPKDKLIVINGGADVNKIKFYPSNRILKNKHNIPEDSLTLGFIGMNKGEFDDLIPFIEAINNLKKQRNINWFTTGSIISREIKNKYHISNELKEFGWQDYDTYIDAIGCADVFILVQRENLMNEARWPNKIGDYLAAGRLILTNPVGEIKTLINKYPDTFVITKYSSEAITITLENLFQRKKTLINQGKYVRSIAEKDLAWKFKADKLMEFYNKIIS